METKLTINELAPYLPYKLQICYRVLDLENGNPNTDNPDDRMKDCIMIMNGARLDQCLLPETDRWYDKNSVFKPILRPLSDLTREIEHNGKIITPMLELYKVAKGVFQSEIKYHSIMATNQIQVEMVGYRNYFFGLFNSEGDVRLGLGYNFRMYSTDLLLSDNKGEEVQFQNILFKNLYEWHFDLHGLIEKGLAININTLTNKK